MVLPLIMSNTGDMYKNWLAWKKCFLEYMEKNNYIESEEHKISALKSLIGTDALKSTPVYHILYHKAHTGGFSTLARKLERLDTHFGEMRNELVERYNFFNRFQSKYEPIEIYILDLKEKAKTCNFGYLRDSIIRDKVIANIHSKELRSKLFQTLNLDLATLVKICKLHEAENKSNTRKIVEKKQTQTDASHSDNGAIVKTSNTNNKKIAEREQNSNKTENANINRKTRKDSKNDETKPDSKMDNSDNDLIDFKEDYITDEVKIDSKGMTSNHNMIMVRRNSEASGTQYRQKCWRCNDNHDQRGCPAWRYKCEKCGERNHFTDCCQIEHLKTGMQHINMSAKENISNPTSCQHENQPKPVPRGNYNFAVDIEPEHTDSAPQFFEMEDELYPNFYHMSTLPASEPPNPEGTIDDTKTAATETQNPSRRLNSEKDTCSIA